jgi:hypothetical protein
MSNLNSTGFTTNSSVTGKPKTSLPPLSHKEKQLKRNLSVTLFINSLLDTHASSQVPEPEFYFPDLLDDDEEIQTEEPKVNPPAPSSSMVNRPVEVDALLENWRTQIRKAGVESEELYISAISEISETEFDRETSIAENMFVELEDVVESEIVSLEETIMYLANKGRATDKEDPRIKELNSKIAAAGKSIRNRAVEIRYHH